jgi:hypothetical protein
MDGRPHAVSDFTAENWTTPMKEQPEEGLLSEDTYLS